MLFEADGGDASVGLHPEITNAPRGKRNQLSFFTPVTLVVDGLLLRPDLVPCSVMDHDLPPIPDALWRPLSRSDARLCADLWNACFVVDGGYRMVEQEWVEELTDPIDNPAEDGVIAVHADGHAIAVGLVQIPPATTLWRSSGWGAVHPAYRGRGIGSAVLAWRDRRAQARFAATSDAVPKFLWDNKYDVDVDQVALLMGAGYRPARHWFEMVRDLAQPIAPVSVDDGLVVVPYDPALSESMRLANNDAFRDHWASQPQPEERWNRYFVGGDFFRPDLSFVVLDGELVVGFLAAACYPHDFEDRGRTEVWAETIGTRRDYRKRGVASAAITALLLAAADSGYEYVALGVDSGSPTGALGLYERRGFVVEKSSTSYAKPARGTDWSALDEA